MKLLSRFFILGALVGASSFALGQTTVSVKGGVSFSNVIVKNEDGIKGETQSNPGIRLGVAVSIPLPFNLYLQPGIGFVEKGFKQDKGAYINAANFKVDVSYIELPVNLLYKPKIGNGRLLIGTGAYLAYGTGGSWHSDNNIVIGDIVTENRGKAIFKNDFMDGEFGNYLYGKPLDYGANFLVGYEFFKRLSVQFDAQLGLANLQPKFGDVKRNGSLKNRGVGFSIGYVL